jgi:plasmid stabilization system protein ParE
VTVEVRLRPEAEQDLAEAARWYEEQQPGLGLDSMTPAVLAEVSKEVVQGVCLLS